MFDESLLQDFITESEEHLEEMENYLLQLESDTDNREILNDIFRCIHTIKGAAEFVGLEKVSDFTHRLENLLDILRQGSGDLTAEIVDLFIEAKDRIARLVKDLDVHAEENTAIDDICRQVDDWIARFTPETAPADVPLTDAPPPDLKTDFLDEEEPAVPELLGGAELNPAAGSDGDTPVAQSDAGAVAGEAQPADGSAAGLPDAGHVMVDGGKIPELESEELGDEDNDRELFEIFLQQVKHKVAEIVEATAEIADGDSLRSCDRIRDALNLLTSSTNYMGYAGLKRFLDAWSAATDALRRRAADKQSVSPESMRPFIDRIVGHFPQIDFDLPPSYSAGPNPGDAAGGDRDEDAPAEPARGAGEEEDRSLIRRLENAFDLFDETADDSDRPASSDVPPVRSPEDLSSVPVPSAPGVSKTEIDGARLPAGSLAPVEDDRPDAAEISAAAAPEEDADAADGPAPEDIGQAAHPAEAASRPETPGEGDHPHAGTGKKNMRVDTEKIDALMNQVGELVVSRSWFSQLVHEMRELHQDMKESAGLDPGELKKIKGLAGKITEATSVLGRVVNDLQDGVMKIRMLPISQLFNRYPRLVRDLVQNTGKKVRLDISGESTELDKMIIEQMSDPLIHIIRNAVDHGIETVAERKQLGKPEAGTLELVAYHESNHVVIEIVDDGRGIDPERVKAAALKREVLPRDELERMTPKELVGLIMRPGFSTAAEVTHTSGRGVGMDVVKKNIEKLNGTIEIDSKAGFETRLKIKIPLTLAIISALLVHVGAKSFAIPLSAVEETLRIFRDQISTVEGFEVIHLRNRTLPLLQLSDMFDIETAVREDQKAYVVIVSSGTRRVGLLVDTLIGQEEVVIKPLADYIQEDSAFSGATILGDGKISLILDVDGLVNLAVRKHSLSRAGALGFDMPEPGVESAPDLPPPEMTLQ
jgi:two-component system chemotaxis sensor kinase CheA